MSIKRALATFLKESINVQNLTGGRIYPQRAVEGSASPYVIIRRLGGNVFNDLECEAECVESVVDIAAYGKSSDSQIENIMEAIRNRLSSYQGAMGDLYCHGCTLERSPLDFSRAPTDGSKDWTFISSADYRITHSQPLVDHQ